MPNEYSEPGKLVLSTFDLLIDRIKSTRPLKSNGATLTSGFVYAQLMLGMPVRPEDYTNAWSPMGGASLQAAGADASANTRRAIEAAYKTSRLVDTMIMVSADDTYHAYPQARRISLNYEGILHGMQAKAPSTVAPDVQKRIDAAMKVLYQIDPSDNSIIGKSKLYENYRKNATAYANAKKAYAESQTSLLNDAAMGGAAPMLLTAAQEAVDATLADLKAEGGAKVESALDVLASVGISIQDHIIARARSIFDQWSLGIAGVADPTPLSYVSPSNWADPAGSHDGWTQLKVTHQEYHGQSSFHHVSSAVGSFDSHFSKSEGGGGFSIFGFGAHGGGGKSENSWSSTFESSDRTQYAFHNDAKNLTIELEYALCTINRPWLIGDLFYLRDWYLVGEKKHAISDGTIDGQVNDEKPLLPMVPVQFLAIRNVKISASESDWGQDGVTLKRMHADASAQGSSWNAGGGGGFSCGFFSIGGEGSHSEGSTHSEFHNSASTDSESHVGWAFDGENLTINGTQVVAWLSEIVPASAPLDSPPNT